MTKGPDKNDGVSRRRFLRDAALAAMSAAVLPRGLIPVALADDASILPGKSELRILNDRPVNAETPAPNRRRAPIPVSLMPPTSPADQIERSD